MAFGDLEVAAPRKSPWEGRFPNRPLAPRQRHLFEKWRFAQPVSFGDLEVAAPRRT